MSLRVLVVDDSREKLGHIIRLLQEGGVDRSQVDVAMTGADARRSLSEHKYDLLVLDVALPMRAEDEPDRRGGLRLLDEMVERDIYKKPLSVVGLTGFEDLHREVSDQFRSRSWTLEYYSPSENDWLARLKARIQYIVSQSKEKSLIQFDKDLCVIAALPSPELTALRKVDWNWSVPTSLDQVSFFYEGKFVSKGNTRSVVAAAAPRMGMVAAAVLTMKMIAKFRPRLLAMIGICAGVKGKCKTGDVLVADPAWDWQMGKYETGSFSIAPDQIDIPTGVSERFTQLAEDKGLWFDIYEAFSGVKPDNIPSVKVGPVTSGSAVLAESRILKEIKSQHRKLLGVDMELYGMYAAARDCAPPVPITFGMKSVSDFADSLKGDEYQTYASHVSARALAAFCERYADDFLPS